MQLRACPPEVVAHFAKWPEPENPDRDSSQYFFRQVRRALLTGGELQNPNEMNAVWTRLAKRALPPPLGLPDDLREHWSVRLAIDLMAANEPLFAWKLSSVEAKRLGRLAKKMAVLAAEMREVCQYSVTLAMANLYRDSADEGMRCVIRYDLGMPAGADAWLEQIQRSVSKSCPEGCVYLDDLLLSVASTLSKEARTGALIEARKIVAKGADPIRAAFSRRASQRMKATFGRFMDDDVAVLVRAVFGEDEGWGAQRVRQLRSIRSRKTAHKTHR